MDKLALDFPGCVRREFPDEFELAWQASDDALAATRGQDFAALEKHSPGLVGNDWDAYLRLSTIRMVRVLRLMRQRLRPGARVVDFGSYFGNFSMMTAAAGFETIAFDSYEQYGACLEPIRALMAKRGIRVVAAKDNGEFPAEIRDADAILLMGVIEHIPHTPRLLLEGLRGLLNPGGLLILDTPSLAYIYRRQQLARGETVFPPIEAQYRTEIPFQGHHREYTPAELEWMFDAARFDVVECETFNYSIYGLKELVGTDLENYREMEKEPAYKELLLYALTPREDAAGATDGERDSRPTLVRPQVLLPEAERLRRELAAVRELLGRENVTLREQLDAAWAENRRVKSILRALRHPLSTIARIARGRPEE